MGEEPKPPNGQPKVMPFPAQNKTNKRNEQTKWSNKQTKTNLNQQLWDNLFMAVGESGLEKCMLTGK